MWRWSGRYFQLMFKLFPQSTSALARLAITCVFIAALLNASGCTALFGVKRTVAVPPLLTPLTEANTSQLVAEVNRLASVRAIKGKIDIQFQDTSFAESGLAEKYRTAEGTLVLQRPGQIYLLIQGPFGVDIAQMASDGQHFIVAVLKGDDKYRRFVRGTNNAFYPKLAMDGEKDNNKGDGKKKNTMNNEHTVSVLSNLRPQHFTEALMIRAIAPRADSGLIYTQSEFYQEEADTRVRTKTGARIVRGYYLLDEIAQGGESGARLVRRFWFDRVNGITLARLQTFSNEGVLVTDVSYTEPKAFGEGGRIQMPSHVELTRPQDRYKLSLTYQSPESVTLDGTYGPEYFVFENKWQLPEEDLDARLKKQ
jgi:hypothetical protein